jgi:hypothetical protein
MTVFTHVCVCVCARSFVGMNDANKPTFKQYFELMQKLGVDPYTADENLKVTPGEQSRLNKAMLMSRQLAMHFHGNVPVSVDVAGQGNWTYIPDEMRTEAVTEMLENGINPQSAEYIYPGNFDKAVGLMTLENEPLVQTMKAHGVIYPNAYRTKAGQQEWCLDLTAIAGINNPDVEDSVEQLLSKAYGDGVGKYVLANMIDSVKTTMRHTGYKPAFGSSSTIYTWDLVRAMAEKLQSYEDNRPQSDVVEELKMLLDEYATKPGNAGLKHEIDALVKSVKGGKEYTRAVAAMLRLPIVGIVPRDDGNLTAEDVENGRRKLEMFESELKKLFNNAGLEAPADGDVNIIGNVKLLLARYESMLHDLGEYQSADSKGVQLESIMWTEASVDLLLRSQRGDKLSSTDEARVRGIYQKAREQGVDPKQIEYGLSVLTRVMSDPDVSSWNKVSFKFNQVIDNKKVLVNQEFSKAMKAYYDAHQNDFGLADIAAAYKADDIEKDGFDQSFGSILPFFLDEGSAPKQAQQPGTIAAMDATAYAAMKIASGDTGAVTYAAPVFVPSAVLDAFVWDGDHRKTPGSCVSAPPVSDTGLLWCSGKKQPERQLSTLLTNTNVYGALLATAFYADDRAAVGVITSSFSTVVSPTEAEFSFLVSLDKATADAATGTKGLNDQATESLETYLGAIDPTHVTGKFASITKTTLVAPVVIDDCYWFEFPCTGECDLNDVMNLAKGVRLASLPTDVRLCGTGFLARYKRMDDLIEEHDLDVRQTFTRKVGRHFEGAASADLTKLSNTLYERAPVSADTFFGTFGEFLPPVLASEKDMRCACYCIDHPYTLAFLCKDQGGTSATALTQADVEAACDIMACGSVDLNRVTQANKTPYGKMLHTLRPNRSSAPLTIFFARSLGKESKFPTFLNDVGGHVETVRVSAHMLRTPQQTTALMDVSRAVLPPAKFAHHERCFTAANKAVATHLVTAYRTQALIAMGQHKMRVSDASVFLPPAPEIESAPEIATVIPTAAMILPEDRLEEHEDDPAGQVYKLMGLTQPDLTTDVVPVDLLEIENPRSRCFATLLEMRPNMIRIMLNPALATQPNMR